MNRLEIIGIAIAAGAATRLCAMGAGRLYRAGSRYITDCLVGWMDGLDDLSPGHLVHGNAPPRDSG